jgi:membrane protease YdiL (CAAX protease family)
MTELEQQELSARRRRELSGSIYALLFLLISAWALDRAFAVYLDRLVRAGLISRWTLLLRYVHTGTAVVFLAELAAVVCVYNLGPLRMSLRDMGLTFYGHKWTGPVWGFLAGLLVSATSLPLLRLDSHSDFADLIVKDFFHPQIILLAVVFVILLPVSTEIVFRGIIFKSFLESSSLLPALLLNALVFALVWPIFNPIIGFILGLTTALLYHRFRSVMSAVVANAVLTTACAATQVWRQL